MIWPFGRKAAATPPPAGPLSLSDAGFFADPYPHYAARRGGPVEVTEGGILLLDHAEITAALKNPALGNAPSRFSALHARFRDSRVAADLANNILPFMDPPRHPALRNAVSRAFSDRLKTFLPDLPALADAQVAQASGRVELIAEISSPFATLVMTRFLGLPDAAGPELKRFTESFFRLFAPLSDADVLARVNVDLADFRSFLRDYAAGDGDGFLGARGRAADSALTEAELIDNAILLFADGIENIERGAASLLALLQREDALREDGLQAAIAEGLRLETPAQVIPRIAREEIVLGGRTCRAGLPVFLALGAANRDPAVFKAPDSFDPNRDASAVLSFGSGRHSCLGKVLGQTQFHALLTALIRRGVSVPDQKISYLHRVGHRWPEALDVDLGR